jgi:hypothetical protein
MTNDEEPRSAHAFPANQWFGRFPWAPICQALERVPVPVGTICTWCGEPIEEGDCGLFIFHLGRACARRPYHCECQARLVLGSLAHIEGRCWCFTGEPDELPAGMTKRQEAIAVWERAGR